MERRREGRKEERKRRNILNCMKNLNCCHKNGTCSSMCFKLEKSFKLEEKDSGGT